MFFCFLRAFSTFEFGICYILETVGRHLILSDEMASVGRILDAAPHSLEECPISFAVEVLHVWLVSGLGWLINCRCLSILPDSMSITANTAENIVLG